MLFRSKGPEAVFREVKLFVKEMKQVADLARSVLLVLIGETDASKKLELEQQQFSDTTLRCVADDATKVLRAFSL